MCILELNKVPMYEIHYEYIKNKYGNKSKCLFTDENLMYEIETKNIYDDFSKNKDMNRIQSKHYRIGACEMNQVIRFALMTQF